MAGLPTARYNVGMENDHAWPRKLPPNQQLVRGQRWPIVGERAPAASSALWTLTIDGCVREPRSYALDELKAMPQIERDVDIHCVTRWSKLGVLVRGIPLQQLLSGSEVLSEARFLSFVARSERSHHTSLPIDEALRAKALIAFEVDGVPLSREHGGPMRMIVPGRYFYKSVKWLARMELLSQDRLGSWEAEAGYHNGADPWREQRYMAATITRQEAAKLIETKDFRRHDLRGIDASERNLSGLQAEGAVLRDAKFCRATLVGADFSRANLCNSHFAEAELRDAKLTRADLEGADFSAADLRGADLRGACLFGTSFCQLRDDGTTERLAQMDETTRLEKAQLPALTEDQRQVVESIIASVNS